jgi:hypothetical protein
MEKYVQVNMYKYGHGIGISCIRAVLQNGDAHLTT